MIIVKGATRAEPSEMWISLAKGLPDQYGNPFTLVKINALKNTTHNARTQGFEDVIIEKNARGKVSISYRAQGCAVWLRTPLGTFYSEIPKTPHNMQVLVESFYDEVWEIDDVILRAEIKREADKLEESLTPKEKEFNRLRRLAGKRNALENPSDVRGEMTPKPGNVENRLQSQKSIDLYKKEQELNERAKVIKDKELRLAQTGSSAPKPVTYSKEYLEKQPYLNLRRLAKKIKGDLDGNPKKPDLINIILGSNTPTEESPLKELEEESVIN